MTDLDRLDALARATPDDFVTMSLPTADWLDMVAAVRERDEAYERGKRDGLAEAAQWTEAQWADKAFRAAIHHEDGAS